MKPNQAALFWAENARSNQLWPMLCVAINALTAPKSDEGTVRRSLLMVELLARRIRDENPPPPNDEMPIGMSAQEILETWGQGRAIQ